MYFTETVSLEVEQAHFDEFFEVRMYRVQMYTEICSFAYTVFKMLGCVYLTRNTFTVYVYVL